MHFSMEQIQAFVAAAEHGSFSAAARHLGKAQSAISTAIANLELDLDLTLFDRTGRSPLLNDHGKEMLEKAYQLLEQRQCLKELERSSLLLVRQVKAYWRVS